jgi:hypothetical protein
MNYYIFLGKYGEELMQRNKHSKIRNAGLLFEILLRQVTADILDKNKKNKALDIIKENFNKNTELGKELGLYNILLNQKFNSDKKAEYFITEVVKNHAKLNSSRLRREKYNVIKEIKNSFDVPKLLSSKVPNYKIYASIYKLFEYHNSLSPEDKTETYFHLVENITKPEPVTKFSKLVNKTSNLDEDERILTYKILLEKFNSKYTKLNKPQRLLLKEYINNVSNTNNLKGYIGKVIPAIKSDLKRYLKSVDEKIVKIKLTEAINSIDKFCKIDTKSKVVKDSIVVQTMRYMELLKELKKHARKA